MKETVKEKKWIEIILALVWMGLIKIIQAMSLFHFWGGAVSYKNLYKTRERNKSSPYIGEEIKQNPPLVCFFFVYFPFPFIVFLYVNL
jgi:hypothetical protein